jgi:myo-inositol-1(or 4)-monophosphatase
LTPPLEKSSVAAVEQLARDAGAVALRHFEALSTVPVESKGHLDLVTAADQDVERFLTEGLAKAFPEDGIFGEEGAALQLDSMRLGNQPSASSSRP